MPGVALASGLPLRIETASRGLKHAWVTAVCFGAPRTTGGQKTPDALADFSGLKPLYFQ
jgi:hypothetical protein